MNRLRALAAITVPIAAALVVANAPPAGADVSSYLDDIYGSDYNFYGPTSDYLQLGNGVCQLVAMGLNQNAITSWVVDQSGPGIYWPQATYIMIAAEIYLC